MPSSRKSQRQPASPAIPSRSRIIPETGPPRIQATVLAVMNREIARARSAGGNQYVR